MSETVKTAARPEKKLSKIAMREMVKDTLVVRKLSLNFL